jgi:hyperosmotically inducible periplasmic protein
MKTASLVTTLLLAGVLAGPVALCQDADAERAHPGAFVHDSVITTKIKAKLAAEHITSLGRIRVDTDENGVVWLSGSAHNRDAVERAMSIARETEGVVDVKSTVKVMHDD